MYPLSFRTCFIIIGPLHTKLSLLQNMVANNNANSKLQLQILAFGTCVNILPMVILNGRMHKIAKTFNTKSREKTKCMTTLKIPIRCNLCIDNKMI